MAENYKLIDNEEKHQYEYSPNRIHQILEW